MKTFLTICTCAMVSAGIYGFADMALDVKNGTMIEYDRGVGEETFAEPVAATAGTMAKDRTFAQQRETFKANVKKKEEAKEQKAVVAKKEKINVPEIEEPVAINEEVVIEEFATEVKTDSVPVKIEVREFDYREFSRGAPPKYKKNRKKKKE